MKVKEEFSMGEFPHPEYPYPLKITFKGGNNQRENKSD